MFRELLSCTKKFFFALLIFSFATNLLILASPLYSLQLFDRFLPTQNMSTFWVLSGIIVVSLAVWCALYFIRSKVLIEMSKWFETELTPILFKASVRLSSLGQGSSGSQPLRDLGVVKGFISGQGLQNLLDAPWALLFLAVIFLLNPIVGIVALVAALKLLSNAWVNNKLTKDLYDNVNELNMKQIKDVEMATRNSEVIECMSMTPNLIRSWHSQFTEYIDSQAKLSTRSSWIGAVTKTERMMIQIIIMGLSAYMVTINQMTPGGMIAASIMTGKALIPFDNAISTWKTFLATKKSLKRLEAILEKAPNRDSAMALPIPEGRIELEQVTFIAPGSSTPILRQISFQLEAGESLGIIGPSASGKSTLSRLLVGAWKASQGIVRLDGADIYTWNLDDIGNHVGFMPQSVSLFTGSIQSNVARMNPEPDPELVVEAAKKAGVHDLILSLPNGYDTVIGSSGHQLSEGQKQRIGLARAFYNDPSLVVLDEPNSHLDLEGDTALESALECAKENKQTVIIISHRPSILKNVDKVLILKEGQVSKFGTPNEIFSQVTHPKRMANAE